MAFEHYQTLAISPEATSEEIRRAYYRAVKKHPPEKDPEGYKQVNVAYETLRDSKARAQYDALQKHGGAIEELMKLAEESMEQQNWTEAIRLLKRVCVLAPDLDAPKNLLGIAFLNNDMPNEAIKAFESLTKTSPSVPLYWRNLGAAYRIKANDSENGSYARGENISFAIKAYETAHDLEPINLSDYLEIAECHLVNNNKNLALIWAGRAVGSDADATSLEALIYICRVHILNNDQLHLERTTKQVSELCLDDDDFRKYAASRLAITASEFFELARKNEFHGLLKPVSILLKTAQRLDPDNKELGGFHDAVSAAASALEEYDNFMNDRRIPDSFKRLASFFLADALGNEIEDREALFNDILNDCGSVPERKLPELIRNIKTRYPGTYQLAEDLFKKIEEHLGEEERKDRELRERQREAAEREKQARVRLSHKNNDAENRTAYTPSDNTKSEKLHYKTNPQQYNDTKVKPGYIIYVIAIVSMAFMPIVLSRCKDPASTSAQMQPLGSTPNAYNVTPIYTEFNNQNEQLIDHFEFSNVTAKDTITNLTWTLRGDLADDPLSWEDSQSLIDEFNRNGYGNYNNWRLPTKDELRALLKYCGDKAPVNYFNSRGFRFIKPDGYWAFDDSNMKPYAVDMNNGNEIKKISKCYVLLVRADQENSEKADNNINISTGAEITKEEVAGFINSFLQSIDSHDIQKQLSFYADQVNYFTWGNIPKKEVRKDKVNHFKRWQEISSEFDGEFTLNDVYGRPDKKEVVFQIVFNVKNSQKAVRGIARNTWVLQRNGTELQIIDEKQQIISRNTEPM